MKTDRLLVVAALTVLLQACASAPPAPPPPPPPPPPPGASLDYAVVRVFYGTDRNLDARAQPAQRYGTRRASLTYGTCDVSIPRDHRMGELDAPSVWRLEFREDPARHVVLLGVAVQSRDQFFTGLSAPAQAGCE